MGQWKFDLGEEVECVEIDQEGLFIVAKLDEDHSLVNIYAPTDSIPSPHWGLTWDSIAPARTQCIAAFQSEQT